MMNLKLVRISASENSFIFVDATKETPIFLVNRLGFVSVIEFVKNWTAGSKGLSADGMVFVTASEANDVDYNWDFYNCDGSSAEMCGNAARAMHVFVSEYLNFKDKTLKFSTLAGLVSTQIFGGNLVKVEMPKWKIIKDSFVENINLKQVEAILLNTGVPHLVIEVVDINDKNYILNLAKSFRFFDVAGPRGTNVTFYQSGCDKNINAITFERGVEGLTKSCGTGAVAAAIAFLHKENKNIKGEKLVEQQIELKVPGGDLRVIINFIKQSAYLIGEAQINYEIHL